MVQSHKQACSHCSAYLTLGLLYIYTNKNNALVMMQGTEKMFIFRWTLDFIKRNYFWNICITNLFPLNCTIFNGIITPPPQLSSLIYIIVCSSLPQWVTLFLTCLHGMSAAWYMIEILVSCRSLTPKCYASMTDTRWGHVLLGICPPGNWSNNSLSHSYC